MAKFGIDIDEVLRSLLPGMVEIYNNRFHDSLTVDDIKEFDVDISFPKVKQATGESASKWFFQQYDSTLFRESPVIEGAVNAIKRLREADHQVYLVSYQKSISNKINTLEWLSENGFEYDGICFIKDKTIVHLDYFIDDNDWNFIRCNCTHGVLINAPYNKNINLELVHKVSNCETMERFDSLSDFVDKFLDLPF